MWFLLTYLLVISPADLGIYWIFISLFRYDSGKVDISDLTWEQKERVLRYLFARMNGGSSLERKKMSSAPALPAIEQASRRHSLIQSQDDLT